MTRTEWIQARASELFAQGVLMSAARAQATAEYNVRFARLTVIDGGKQ